VSDVRLRIDRVAIELADQSRAREVEVALRLALERLAERLSRGSDIVSARRKAELVVKLGGDVGRLVTTEALLAAGGPERLAAALFEVVEQRLLLATRSTGGSA
jgi:hypothetical protein